MQSPRARNRCLGLVALLVLCFAACSSDAAGPSAAGGGTSSTSGGAGASARSTVGGATSGGATAGGGNAGTSAANAGSSGTSAVLGGSTGATSVNLNQDAGITIGGTSAQGGTTNSGGGRGGGGALGGASTGVSRQGGAGRDAGVPDGGLAGASGGKTVLGGASGGSTSNSSAGSTGTFTPCPGATQTLNVGSGQAYATVQAAVNAVGSGNSKWVQINVKAGTYKEQVTISKPFVCLVGESPTTTRISYTIDNNIVTGGTVLVKANDFSAANIAFENTHGKGESGGQNQAVAMMAQGQRHQFRNCRFLSYQDTVYTNTGTQYFRDCYIQGTVDYIFGDATAVFEDCTMHNIAEGTAVTAPRTPQNTTYGFVFLGGSLTADSSVRSNHVNLGRPWGPTAAAAYLNVTMGAHITSEGWTTMSDNTLAQTRFSEYKSTGPGASTSSATRSSRQLSDAQAANYTIAKVFGSWTPGYSQ